MSPTAQTVGSRWSGLFVCRLRPAPADRDGRVGGRLINVPAQVIDNRCNGEPVALSGQLLMVTTTARPNGGTTVRSVTVTQGREPAC